MAVEVPTIALENVSVVYRGGQQDVTAVQGLTLNVAKGEFVCLLGPSGCGKSTVLRLVAGFISPSEGSIRVDGEAVGGPSADRGFVFQRHNLFPWHTVRGNIEYGLRQRNLPRRKRVEIVASYLEALGLSEFGDSYPTELSEGMQQRVGLARAIANEPAILIMDEPFASLDALTAIQMRKLLCELLAARPTTVMFVTHDVDESLLLADRIVILTARPGRIREEVGVDLPRPRGEEMRGDERYIQLRRRLMQAVVGR